MSGEDAAWLVSREAYLVVGKELMADSEWSARTPRTDNWIDCRIRSLTPGEQDDTLNKCCTPKYTYLPEAR